MLSDNIQVLYQANIDQIVPTTGEVLRLGREQTRADSTRDVVERTMAEESLDHPDDITDADRAKYWETRDRINTISAIPPPYMTACIQSASS